MSLASAEETNELFRRFEKLCSSERYYFVQMLVRRTDLVCLQETIDELENEKEDLQEMIERLQGRIIILEEVKRAERIARGDRHAKRTRDRSEYKACRNARIVNLREAGKTFPEIASIVTQESQDRGSHDCVLTPAAARMIYNRSYESIKKS